MSNPNGSSKGVSTCQKHFEAFYQGADKYKGFPVMSNKYALNERYLERLYQTFTDSRHRSNRLFGCFITLGTPISLMYDESRIMERFMASLSEKLAASYERKKALDKFTHRPNLANVWAREYSKSSRPHYHVALFLNGNAYRAIGEYQLGRDNLYNKIIQAWASALRVGAEEAQGLVFFHERGQYFIDYVDDEMANRCFHRASYLAKEETKIKQPLHSFGSSKPKLLYKKHIEFIG